MGRKDGEGGGSEGGGGGEATIVAVDSQNTETSMECQNQTVLSNGECSLGVEGSDDATSSSVAEQPPQSVSSSNPDASAEIKEQDDKITDESALGQIDFSKEELNEVSERCLTFRCVDVICISLNRIFIFFSPTHLKISPIPLSIFLHSRFI